MRRTIADEIDKGGVSTVATSKPSILIVEDDRNIMHVLSTALDVDGYRVLGAATGQRATSSSSTWDCPTSTDWRS